MKGLEIPAQFLMVYCLIHLRFVGMMFTFPLFFTSATPIPFRFLFITLLAVASMGTMTDAAFTALGTSAVSVVLFESWLTVFFMAMRELFIGMAIGLLAGLPLVALQVSGELISMAMGFSMASVMDPLTQRQSSIVGQLQFLIGLWFYFRWNGHLLLVQAVVESLKLIPLAKTSWIPAGDMAMGDWFAGAFNLAIRIVVPYYCALLLADVGLGFLARTVPQMNVFVLGLPIKIALGLFVLAVALPMTVEVVYRQLERWIEFALRSSMVWL
ncbi:flagellar biosynthetic protein FliR [Synergistales bacterium]|nr:flagellar biosynthetic protein FliR [Synergistales bacterium]